MYSKMNTPAGDLRSLFQPCGFDTNRSSAHAMRQGFGFIRVYRSPILAYGIFVVLAIGQKLTDKSATISKLKLCN
jgi:hypothetical protein